MRLRFAAKGTIAPSGLFPNQTITLQGMRLISLPNKKYVVARAVSTGMALALALIYSKALGLNNRSLIAFVMTVNSLIWILVTSGTTLTFRKNDPKMSDKRTRESFYSLIFLESILSITLLIITLQIYSIEKNYLTINFIAIAVLYSATSGIALITSEIALAYKHFNFIGYLDAISVFLQFLFFGILYLLGIFSISVSLLLAFSTSYLVYAFLGLRHIFKGSRIELSATSPLKYLKSTRGNHSLGFSLGVMDRMDRFLISVLFPTILLGKYAVMSSTISVFRFLPDAVSKIIVSRKTDNVKLGFRSFVVIFIVSSIAGGFLVFCSQIFIRQALGTEWLLPIVTTIGFAIMELLRGLYQISANRQVSLGYSSYVHKQSVRLPFIALFLATLFSYFFGLNGLIFGFLLAYLIPVLMFRNRDH